MTSAPLGPPAPLPVKATEPGQPFRGPAGSLHSTYGSMSAGSYVVASMG
jgi:hypothetical protein